MIQQEASKMKDAAALELRLGRHILSQTSSIFVWTQLGEWVKTEGTNQ